MEDRVDLSRFVSMAEKLDRLDYYQILGVPRNAAPEQIRLAYHKRARSVHPDRFYDHDNKEFRQAIDKIFKRIAEAYVVLRTPDKRRKYDAGLKGPERKIRYTEEDDVKMRDEKINKGQTPQGNKLYEEAARLRQNGSLKKAIQTLRMAIAFEKDNMFFIEQLSTWSEELRLSKESST